MADISVIQRRHQQISQSSTASFFLCWFIDFHWVLCLFLVSCWLLRVFYMLKVESSSLQDFGGLTLSSSPILSLTLLVSYFHVFSSIPCGFLMFITRQCLPGHRPNFTVSALSAPRLVELDQMVPPSATLFQSLSVFLILPGPKLKLKPKGDHKTPTFRTLLRLCLPVL